jgi:hypothetical protein
MATPKLDNATMQQAVDLVAKHGAAAAAAQEAGVPASTMRDRVREAKRMGFKPTKGLVDTESAASLRAEVKRLTHEMADLQKTALTHEAIKRTIIGLKDGIENAEPPGWLLSDPGIPSSPGVPTLFMSDWHWGEVVHPSQINGVNRFNVVIAKQRVKLMTERAIHLLRILDPKMRYPGIVAVLGGDMISGNIHDELTATNELNSMPAVIDLWGEIKAVLTHLADTFGKVFVPCVTGNHGRDTKKIWGKDRHHTSFDWLLYQFLQKHFERDKRITFQIPDGPDAYFRIYGHRYLLTHGDQFRGGDGMIGALGPVIRGDHKKRSRNAQIDMEYDTLLLGHWHQYIQLNRLIINGSIKGYDEYAYSNNFGFEEPQQALWVTHPKYGITYRMPVKVDHVRSAPKTAWVSVA